MLERQIRFIITGAILFSYGTIVGLMADWIRNFEFIYGFEQQSFIFLCAGLSFLFWDHFFLLRSSQHFHYNYRLFSYLLIGFVGFSLLALARICPLFFYSDQLVAISNSLTITGLFLLLVTALLRFTKPLPQDRLCCIFWLTGLSVLIFMLSRGFFTYLFLCLTSTYAGRGLLNLLGIPELNKKSLAPFATLIFWTILLGFFVGLGIPIKYLSLAIWPLTIFLIWRGYKKNDLDLSFNASDLLIVAIPLLVAFRYTIYGFFIYPGSPNLDHWSYIVTGQYLWQFSRCAQGIMSPLYTYTNMVVCDTRYISPGFLALFSSLLNRTGDTQPVAGVFLPWGIFVYSASLRFMIETITTSKLIRTAYLLFGALAGWLMMLVVASNFDNLLIISYFPVIFAICKQTNFSFRWNFLLGIILASIVYTYPEMTPFILPAAGFFILERLNAIKATPHKIFTVSITTLICALTALLPYLSTALLFLKRQVNNAYATGPNLPGGSMWHEIIDPTYRWVALWGMGGAIEIPGFYLFRSFVAVILFTLFFYGCFLLIKTKEWALFAVVMVFIVSIIYFDFYRNYSYGTYKLLVLFWWLVAYLVVVALMNLIELTESSQKVFCITVISVYSAYLLCVVILSIHVMALPYKSIGPFKQLESMSIPPGKSLAVVVDNDFYNIWAAYYLRDLDVFLYPLGGYMIWYFDPLSPQIKQANLEDVQYILTENGASNSPPGTMVWRNSIYNLTKLPETWSYGIEIQNPNGVDTANKKKFYWLGNDLVKIRILSDFDGCGQITFWVGLGPSLPDVSLRHLLYSNDNKTYSMTVASGWINLFTSLREGPDNIVTLQVLDKPTLSTQPNGDKRTLLLGVFDFSVKKCQ